MIDAIEKMSKLFRLRNSLFRIGRSRYKLRKRTTNYLKSTVSRYSKAINVDLG